MSAYVLVHGGWHGGWCWRFVHPLLQRAGHDVYSPSLTGVGERRRLAGLDVDPDTHIDDIVSILEMEDLAGVVLVGHSYGGMVITGTADRAGPPQAPRVSGCLRARERQVHARLRRP